MIEDGALEGVDEVERATNLLLRVLSTYVGLSPGNADNVTMCWVWVQVYGWHNWPASPVGTM